MFFTGQSLFGCVTKSQKNSPMFVTKSMTERKNLGFLKRNSLTSGFYFNSRTCPQFLKKKLLKKKKQPERQKYTFLFCVFILHKDASSV